MSIKKALLANFFKNHARSIKTPSEPPHPLTPTPELLPRSHSSITLSPKFKAPIPNSLTQSQSSSDFSTAFIPSTYKNAFNKLTTKKILSFPNLPTDENTVWLIYSFLLLVSLADKRGPAAAVVHNRSQALSVFKEYLKNPGRLAQLIRRIPIQIQSEKHSSGFVTKLEASYKLINSAQLGGFVEIYEIVRESLGFLKSLTRSSSPKPENTPKKLRKNMILTKTPPQNSLTSKFSQTILRSASALLLSKSAKKPELTKSTNLTFKTQAFRSTNLLNKHFVSLSKAERFMAESRVNKRLQERILKFLKEKQKIECLGMSEEEVGQRLIDEFCLEMTEVERASSQKFLQYYRRSKEFGKMIKRMMIDNR